MVTGSGGWSDGMGGVRGRGVIGHETSSRPTPEDEVGGGVAGARLGCVCEGEAGGVDDPVVTNQTHRDLERLAHPAPSCPEGGDVRHHAQHAIIRPEGRNRMKQTLEKLYNWM